MLQIVSAASAALLIAFAVATGWALESDGVALIETRAPDGTVRSTRVWHAESDGELWLEAGTPENPWFEDIQRRPTVTFTARGRSRRYTATRVDDPAGHMRIRALLREKYGARDWWVGLLVDGSRSVAVRLEPQDEQ